MNKRIIFPLLFLLSGIAQASSPLTNLFIVPEVARHTAPDFVLKNLGGGEAGLADYKGKLVLLNFWATWCIPCREEMPGMETLWQKYKEQGFVVVAVSVDDGSKKRVETFTKLLDLSFPVLLDPESEVSDLYKVSDMPTSFLIDRNGNIISRIVGTEEWSSPEAAQFVEKLLAK
jgi:cytochrome c biogenesis protein CcmG, thiol:disulfide interchange protein DsbE